MKFKTSIQKNTHIQPSLPVLSAIKKDIGINRHVYFMLLPVLAYYIIFCYLPMLGVVIAFKDYSMVKGVFSSDWVGVKHFIAFFNSLDFSRTIKNTLAISFYDILFGFPAPIILAMLLNEVRHKFFKKAVQTITYLPHFISLVVICGMLKEFTVSTGFINDIVAFFGGSRQTMLLNPNLFRTLYISSGIWQNIGWNTIIYLAALAAVDVEQYEASKIDGAGRLKQAIYVTLPGIKTTIVTLLILRIGMIMSIGFEKIILLYNPSTYETADVISTLVYRKGLQGFQYSFSTAVGLFNGVINFSLVIFANFLSRKINETSLW